MIVWMDEEPLVPGKQYVFKQTTKSATGSIQKLRYRMDVNTLHSEDAPRLSLNEIGRVQISLSQAISFDGYRRNRDTGSFIVVDRITNATVAAGMILLRTTSDETGAHWEVEPMAEDVTATTSNVTVEEREARFGQKSATVLLTGLPGSGKTSTAFGVERALFNAGHAAMVLDGQNMRLGLSRDLNFSAGDRSENLRRASEVARIANNSGLIVLMSIVAPREEVRAKAKSLLGDNFFIVHMKTDEEVRQARLEAEAVDLDERKPISYEEPTDADLVLDSNQQSPEECITQIVELLQSKKIID